MIIRFQKVVRVQWKCAPFSGLSLDDGQWNWSASGLGPSTFAVDQCSIRCPNRTMLVNTESYSYNENNERGSFVGIWEELGRAVVIPILESNNSGFCNDTKILAMDAQRRR